MPYEDDEIAFCHHCGKCHPAEDKCQCLQAQSTREGIAAVRKARIAFALFIGLYVFPMVCAIGFGMYLIFTEKEIAGALILGACFFFSWAVLLFSEQKQNRIGHTTDPGNRGNKPQE